MLGDGMLSFGVAPVADFEEPEVLAKDAALEPQLAGDAQRGGREFEVALFIVKTHLQVILYLRDAADLVEKVHVPRPAPILAVGDSMQANVFLHLNDLADGFVLDAAQFGGGNAAAFEILARLQHFFRAQQASDVIRTKRRPDSISPSSHWSLAIRATTRSTNTPADPR